MLLKKLNPSNLFLRDFELNKSLMKKDLGSDYKAYLELKSWFDGKQIEKKRLYFYHPGGGNDMLSLLTIYDSVVSRKNKTAYFVFVDMRDFYDGVLYQLKKYVKKVDIKEIPSKIKNRYHAKISFKDRIFHIIYYVNDVSNFFPPELRRNIDIYYERAFEMFRCNDNILMYQIYSNMNKQSLMMTDHSFNFASSKNKFRKLRSIPKKFGLYQNFQIWQRTPKD